MFISLRTRPALDPSFHVHVPSLDITRCNIWNLTLEELAAETKQRDVVQQAWTLHAIEYNCGFGGFCAVMCRRCSMSGCLPLACLSWAYMSNMTGTSAFHFTMRCAEPWQDLRASKTAQTLMINRLDDIERRRRITWVSFSICLFKARLFPGLHKGLAERGCFACSLHLWEMLSNCVAHFRCEGTKRSKTASPMLSIDDAMMQRLGPWSCCQKNEQLPELLDGLSWLSSCLDFWDLSLYCTVPVLILHFQNWKLPLDATRTPVSLGFHCGLVLRFVRIDFLGFFSARSLID